MPSLGAIDLGVIDEAYGRDADLYVDVLRISGLASQEDVKSAFFDRRSELFAILSKLSGDDAVDEITTSQRRFTEKRMDAVVMAYRVLKHPQLREEYNAERQKRLQRRAAVYRASPTVSKKEFVGKPAAVVTPEKEEGGLRSVPSDEQRTPKNRPRSKQPQERQEESVKISVEQSPPERSSGRPKNRARRFQVQESPSHTGTDDDEASRSVVSSNREANPGDGILDRIRGSHLVQSITEEIHGTYVDTYSAFDQVFNAFTLQESDIDAVCGRIDKVKYQFQCK